MAWGANPRCSIQVTDQRADGSLAPLPRVVGELRVPSQKTIAANDLEEGVGAKVYPHLTRGFGGYAPKPPG